ncbi:MAG: hypothetical protein Unbinned3585contig1000_3 [Prokaryotic dsDNA virus sp.]|jgi:hypothetical protein|nr:MAG: hypothetical protein Unbinned3585contig1000_3 [Prokaryotic dsDNA virus sp.]
MRITCSRWGTKFSAFQVERLYSECRAWMDFDEFHVFTDQPEPLHPNIIRHEIPKSEAYRSWWSKLLQFKEFTSGKTLSLDIDIHIRDRVEVQFSESYMLAQLDPLSSYIPEKNVKYINSSFLTYDGDFGWVHDKYMADWKNIQHRYRGDQEFMYGEYKENFRYHKPVFESYKWSAKQKGYSEMPIVNFHGEDVKKDL